MAKLMWVAAGGALGAMARYGISLRMQAWFGEVFPFGTLLANVLGCFLLGLLLQIGVEGSSLSPELRLGLGTGVMGALTTFSTFSYESVRLVEGGQIGLALANVAANLILGFGATLAGFALARVLAA